MSKFKKMGKYYEWHFQNNIPKPKKQSSTSNHNEEKEINVNINMSTLVYMLAVFYWCRFANVDNNKILTGICILFVLDILFNIIKQLKGE